MVCHCKGGGADAKNPRRFLLRQYYALRKIMRPGSTLQRAVNTAAQCENQLAEMLDEVGRGLLTRLVKTQHEIDSITATENFILGFRLGVRLMAECMDEDDGDIRNGGG